MCTRNRFRLPILAGLLALGLLSGCGSSSTETPNPTVAPLFTQHGVFFRNNTTMTVGYNGFGQLGDGTRTSRATAQVVPGLGSMRGSAAGVAHTLVFANNSSVMAWGLNNYGQLGVPTSATATLEDVSLVPVRAGSLTHVTAVAAGDYHSLAVSDGNVYGWGYNGSGQLGDGSLVSTAAPTKVLDPTNTAGTFLTDAVQVAAGAFHSLALTRDPLTDERKVWAWGLNDYGQLGRDTATTGIGVIPVEVVFPGSLSKPKQIAAAGRYSLALMDDGTVWAWGYNGYGQLGTTVKMGTRLATFTPVQVKIPHPTDTTVTLPIDEISAGSIHVLARVGGTVWGWGLNEAGQLGNNPTIGDIDNPPNTAKPVLALISGVAKIHAFGYSSYATLTNGELWGWGYNSFGQLGAPAGKVPYEKVPVRMSGY